MSHRTTTHVQAARRLYGYLRSRSGCRPHLGYAWTGSLYVEATTDHWDGYVQAPLLRVRFANHPRREDLEHIMAAVEVDLDTRQPEWHDDLATLHEALEGTDFEALTNRWGAFKRKRHAQTTGEATEATKAFVEELRRQAKGDSP